MGKRVLFIDDELRVWEEQLRNELGKFGFELKGEENPYKAIEAISSYKPDIVLLDILFPMGYLGKPTLIKIKERNPNLPVVMITGTMHESEYDSEDYALADYRYSKAALSRGNYLDLAQQLDRLIERNKARNTAADEENRYLRYGFIVGKTKVMQELADMIEKVADQGHTVLITGKSGTGKELFARAIHYNSPRKSYPFVALNCGAIPESLIESELFGHMKGAFTDAITTKKGLFELADGGTLFLDEISELPLLMQVKLLRGLEDREFKRVGGTENIRVDIRIIAATNKDIEDAVKEKRFREDLFYRLNVIQIKLPPLRERKEDIPLFFEHFIKKANKESQKSILPDLRDDLKEKLLSYPWAGNIRELENMICRAVALANENFLQVANFPELGKETEAKKKPSGEPSTIAEGVYKGDIGWEDLKDQFGARGDMRRMVLLAIIDRWIKDHKRRPTSDELAELLSITPNNMRRILSEYKIKLLRYPRKSEK
ncbi:MAG: sigma-54-dependent Fis family transcriptional regulator [Deltaproteobacteria bacterium]|nr:sigma-54-dependent Fis family transcriptional regulator [Deltaproteobacteria bacterium]